MANQPTKPGQGSAPVATPVSQPVSTPQAPEPVVQPAPAPQAPEAQGTPTPAGMTDRSQEQWEKLTDNNRKLFEANQILQQELIKRSQAQQTFQPIQQPAQQQVVPQPVNPDDFVFRDPVTGERYVDDVKLKSAIAESNRNAELARQEAAAVRSYIQANEQKQLQKEETEAFSAYPQLNPKGQEFDINFHNATSALILHSLVNPQNYGGRSLTFKEAADSVRTMNGVQPQVVAMNNIQGNVQPVPQGTPSGQSAQDLKVQASVNLPSQPQAVIPAQTQEDIQQLRVRTRYGDDEALAQRLMHTEHIVPKT